jgi:hypothetical protein
LIRYANLRQRRQISTVSQRSVCPTELDEPCRSHLITLPCPIRLAGCWRLGRVFGPPRSRLTKLFRQSEEVSAAHVLGSSTSQQPSQLRSMATRPKAVSLSRTQGHSAFQPNARTRERLLLSLFMSTATD